MKTLFSAAFCMAIAAGAASPVTAEDVTVKSLTAQGFTVVSSFMTQIGPGLFLQNGERLYLCFVTERRETQTITTNYCKAVE